MSKLQKIREVLEKDPNVFVAEEGIVDYLDHDPINPYGPGGRFEPRRRGSYRDPFDLWIISQQIVIPVSPVTPIYDVKELGEFMNGIFPIELMPYNAEPVVDYRAALYVGLVVFHEKIAREKREIKRTIELVDKDLSPFGFKDGVWSGELIEDIPHIRRIEVYVYPDKETALENAGRVYTVQEYIFDYPSYVKRRIKAQRKSR